MKIRGIVIAVFMVLLIGTINTFAQYSDVPKNASYSDALERLSALGIMNGAGNNTFKPNDVLTREQFARMIVAASGLEEDANMLKGSTIFPDVPSQRWSSGYINQALKKGFITGMPDGKFHPYEKITFAQGCAVLVKALGYTDQDVQGFWPNNYIEKAKAIGLTKAITLKSSDGLPRWAAAVMVDRLLTTKVKKSNPGEADKVYSDASGLYSECIILGDPSTYDKLAGNQILTDKGIYYMKESGVKLKVGSKYRLKIEGDLIIKAYDSLEAVENITINGVDNSSITYIVNNEIRSLNLSEKTAFYYHGVKQNFDNLKNVLKRNMMIVMAYNDDKTGYDYAVITEPQDIKLGTYTECIILGNSTTSSKLGDKQVLTDKGTYYLSESSMKLELGSKYGLIINNEKINQVYEKLSSTVSARITSVNQTKIVYKEDTGKENSLVLPEKTVYYYSGLKQNYDSLKNILRTDSSIVFAYNQDKTGYEYVLILDPEDSKLGTYIEAIILGNGSTTSKLGSNQILTDSGIYYLADSAMKAELGNKYGLVIDGDKIVKIGNRLKSTFNITVGGIVDTKVLYRDEAGTENTMVLPDKTVYYYNGVKQNYDSLKTILQANSSIVFNYKDDKSGFDYAVAFDPVYSKPEIGNRLDLSKKRIGEIDFSNIQTIIRNNEFSRLSDIESMDVVYKVSDIWGENSFLLAVGNRVEGKIKAFLPNRTSVKQLQIDSKNYEFDTEMDISKIKSLPSGFDINDSVVALLGYTGKIVEMIYPTDDTVNYAFVINCAYSSSSNTYTAKLLLSDHSIVSYKVLNNPMSLKGQLVTYVKTDNETVVLAGVAYSGTGEFYIRKDEKQIGGNYVADNVKIFNIISNTNDMDAQANVLSWGDIPFGLVPTGYILHMNKFGDFNDINVIVTNDILDQKYKMGVIKKVNTGKPTIIVDGKEYISSFPVNGAYVGAVVKVVMSTTGMESVVGVLSTNTTAINIQAIDAKRVKISGSIYRLKENVAIFIKGTDGTITAVDRSNVDISKNYLNVSAYLDSFGLVSMIVVSEN